MALPSLIVEADFTTEPLEIPTIWEDLSGRVRSARSVTIHQGRQRILDRTEVGRATAVLDNQDDVLSLGSRSFGSGTFGSGIFGGSLARLGNHFRIRAVKDGVTYDLFRGFAKWGQEWPSAGFDAVATVDAEDAFSLLARYELEGQSIASMTTGAHLESVLTTFGWPPTGSIPAGKKWWRLGTTGFSELGTSTFLGETLNQFDPGTATLMATTLTGNLLEHLLNAAETTEGGNFYVSPSGELTFIQRPSPFAPSVAVFGDDPTEYRYSDIGQASDQQLFNDVRVTRRGDAIAVHVTEPSGFYGTVASGPRTLIRNDVLFSDIAQTTQRAAELLDQHNEPSFHPTRLVMRPRTDSPAWPVILGLTLMSRITTRRRVRLTGDVIELDCLVIGVDYDISPNGWIITWALAPAEEVIEGAWYLGHPGFSELGTTTRLG